jgi:hypothetical protein
VVIMFKKIDRKKARKVERQKSSMPKSWTTKSWAYSGKKLNVEKQQMLFVDHWKRWAQIFENVDWKFLNKPNTLISKLKGRHSTKDSLSFIIVLRNFDCKGEGRGVKSFQGLLSAVKHHELGESQPRCGLSQGRIILKRPHSDLFMLN